MPASSKPRDGYDRLARASKRKTVAERDGVEFEIEEIRSKISGTRFVLTYGRRPGPRMVRTFGSIADAKAAAAIIVRQYPDDYPY